MGVSQRGVVVADRGDAGGRIDDDVAVFVAFVILAHDRAQLFAHHGHDADARCAYPFGVLHLVHLRFAQRVHLVGVAREVEAQIPLPVLGLYGNGVELDLDAFVGEHARIEQGGRIAGADGGVDVADLVAAGLAVVCKVEHDALVQEVELGADLPRTGPGRFEIAVGYGRVGDLTRRYAANRMRIKCVVERHLIGAGVIADLGPRSAHLAERQDFGYARR